MIFTSIHKFRHLLSNKVKWFFWISDLMKVSQTRFCHFLKHKVFNLLKKVKSLLFLKILVQDLHLTIEVQMIQECQEKDLYLIQGLKLQKCRLRIKLLINLV